MVHRCAIYSSQKNIEDAKILLQAIKDQGWKDINWAAYIRADNIDADLAQLMVDTGMSYFEIGITSGSQELVRKMRLAYNPETVLNNCKMLVESGFKIMYQLIIHLMFLMKRQAPLDKLLLITGN